MSITPQHVKESLSRAFVQALAGLAGVNLALGGDFDYGVDGTFKQVGVRPVRDSKVRLYDTGVNLAFQLKASTTCTQRGNEVLYDLEAKTYQDLRERRISMENGGNLAPLILILLRLPEDASNWHTIDDQSLVLRHQCLWYDMPVEDSNNKSKVQIRIPSSRGVTPATITKLLSRAKEGWFE